MYIGDTRFESKNFNFLVEGTIPEGSRIEIEENENVTFERCEIPWSSIHLQTTNLIYFNRTRILESSIAGSGARLVMCNSTATKAKIEVDLPLGCGVRESWFTNCELTANCANDEPLTLIGENVFVDSKVKSNDMNIGPYVYGVHPLMLDPRNYKLVATICTDYKGELIMMYSSGCRFYDYDQAMEHWSDPGHERPNIAKRYVLHIEHFNKHEAPHILESAKAMIESMTESMKAKIIGADPDRGLGFTINGKEVK